MRSDAVCDGTWAMVVRAEMVEAIVASAVVAPRFSAGCLTGVIDGHGRFSCAVPGVDRKSPRD